ncbi:hypothetical protein IFM89_039204, partial [Coptis chinensis]
FSLLDSLMGVYLKFPKISTSHSQWPQPLLERLVFLVINPLSSWICWLVRELRLVPRLEHTLEAFLVTAHQLTWKLAYSTFVKKKLKIVMETAEEAIHAQERDPHSAFANRVRELNYGNSYFFVPIKISNLRRVDPRKACEYFNSCFKDPSSFTVQIVGNLNPSVALPLILQYLGGIPKPPEPILHFNRDELRGLPLTFPASIIREVVCTPMVEAQCSVQLTFPIELKNGSMIEEVHFVGFLSKLLETKIMQAPLLQAWAGILCWCLCSLVAINLLGMGMCVVILVLISLVILTSRGSWRVDIVLNEISRLQEECPSEQDVSTIIEIEQQAHENDLQVYACRKTITGLIGFSTATSHDCIMAMSVLRSRLVVCN